MKQSQASNTFATIVTAELLPSTRQRPTGMVQNFLLVWLDSNIDETNENFQNNLLELRNIVRIVEQFTDVDQCIAYIGSIKDEKVFLIISGTLSENIVPLVHNLAQLDAIFIFRESNDIHIEWENKWSKVQGIFESIESICKQLKMVARECDHDTIPMSFVSKQVTTESQANLNKLPPAFMYSQLFKEITLEIVADDEKSLTDLVIYGREKVIPEQQLSFLQHGYYDKSPIWWYTCEIFTYSMLNKALRSFDMETMVKMGFLIRSLYQQLKHLHEAHVAQFEQTFKVYRRQGLFQDDFQHLFNAKGGVLSFNNFLSTSTEPKEAMKFVQRTLNKSEDIVGILFIMTIHTTKLSTSTTPFAFIYQYSAIPQEKEILFSMNTVLRVDEIKQTDNNHRVWEVHMILTDDNDLQLGALMHCIQKGFGGTGWDRMGKLMLRVGQFNHVERLYTELLKTSTDDPARAHLYHMLGYSKDGQGHYKEAVLFYEKSVEIYRKTLPEDDPSLANAYNKIGLAYSNMGDNTKALRYYEKAHTIKENARSPNPLDLATSYNNIGLVYSAMGDYSKALEHYGKSNKIFEKTLPLNHPDLATCYNNIGSVYNALGQHPKALQFFEKSNKIFENALLQNHPNLADSYSTIGALYNAVGDYSKALEFFEKALQIREVAIPSNHSDVAQSYNNLGVVYNSMGDCSKALEFFRK